MCVRVRVLRGRVVGPRFRDLCASGRGHLAPVVHGGLLELGGGRILERRRRRRLLAVRGRLRAVARVSHTGTSGRAVRDGRERDIARSRRRLAIGDGDRGRRGQLRASRGPRRRRRSPGRGQRRYAGRQPSDNGSAAAAAIRGRAGPPRSGPTGRRRTVGPQTLEHHRAGDGRRVSCVRSGPHGGFLAGRGTRHLRGRGRVSQPDRSGR